MRLLWTVIFAVGVLAVLGCGPDREPDTESGATSSDLPTAIETVNANAPPSAVPGGAAIAPSPGSPAGCILLTNAAALRNLGGELDHYAAKSGDSKAGDRLRRSAHQLRLLSQQTTLSGAAASLDQAAEALEALATAGIGDADAVATLTASLTGLGRVVQDECGFEIG